jgi:tetratricopeptide (TPR) repeat protein
MILRTKSNTKTFLLTLISAFLLSTTVGHCADEHLDPPGYVSPHLGDLSPQQYALIRAIKQGDLLTVKRLINIEGVDKDTQDPEERNSLLQLAIREQRKSIFNFLLKINCDVGIQNAYKENSLHEAAITGDKAMWDSLLEKGSAYINTQDKDGNTAFHIAISRGHLECLPSFISLEGFDQTLKNDQGFTVGNLLDQLARNAPSKANLIKEYNVRLGRDFETIQKREDQHRQKLKQEAYAKEEEDAKKRHFKNQHEAEEQYEFGQHQENLKNYAQAIEHYEKAATYWHPEAQYRLGCLYYNGKGVIKDAEKARKWWEGADARGHEGARYNLRIFNDPPVFIKISRPRPSPYLILKNFLRHPRG